MKVLVVEDEQVTSDYLNKGLVEEGYVVDVCRDGTEADEAVYLNQYDLIVLDVMLPHKDGLHLCREWRARGLTTPILFLTARDSLRDRVEGLDTGADDYLVKPFAFEELLARMRALLRRRATPDREPALQVGPVRLDPVSREASLSQRPLDLTPREFQILEHLMRRCGQAVSRTVLWEQVWESHSSPQSNVVDVYVGYLRKKLGDRASAIETVRGAGYRLNPERLH